MLLILCSSPHTRLLRTELAALFIVIQELPRLMTAIVVGRAPTPVATSRARLQVQENSLSLNATFVRATIATHSTVLKNKEGVRMVQPTRAHRGCPECLL